MLIIDRFEGNMAVIETDSGLIHIPMSDLPGGAKEGDVLMLSINDEETADRKKKNSRLMNTLFEK